MAKKSQKTQILALLSSQEKALKLSEISQHFADIPERTLRRWLSVWCDEGLVVKTGKGRATSYQYHHTVEKTFSFAFLQGLDKDLQTIALEQIRDLWTHHSTALEGNTLSLGDTHFILSEGLTISGKPLKDHQEIIGHSSAIDTLYQSLSNPLTETALHALHLAVQTENVTDIYKPQGAWKLEPNGTYTIDTQGVQQFIQYAFPQHVPALMDELIHTLNNIDSTQLTIHNAPSYYAKIHMGFVHIHPYWDGNGRLARLIANLPLLQAGLPPLLIDNHKRRDYIGCLSRYQLAIGQLTTTTGVWPKIEKLDEFITFCADEYTSTQNLIEKVRAEQQTRY